MKYFFILLILLVGCSHNDYKKFPNDRKETLELLEELKYRSPRLPISTIISGTMVWNSLIIKEYLNENNIFSLQKDYILEKSFATKIFWLVSRINNCHYCLGHQEYKLQKLNVEENEILNLDTDWNNFIESEKIVYEFTYKLTINPGEISEQDINKLKQYYSDEEILEVCLLISRYNAMNRWTDSTGVPQEEEKNFSSNLSRDLNCKKTILNYVTNRINLKEINISDKISSSSQQKRIKIPYENLNQILNYAFKKDYSIINIEKFSLLDEILINKILYVCAITDNAWLLAKEKKLKLLKHLNEKQIKYIGENIDKEEEAIVFAHKLTLYPQKITDYDVKILVNKYGPKKTAEIIYLICEGAFFDRLSLSLGL